jgi:ribosome-associated protein
MEDPDGCVACSAGLPAFLSLTTRIKTPIPSTNLTELISTPVVPDAAPKRVARLNRGSKILKVIIQAILDKKGEHLISMDLRKIPEAVADFFVICEAGSTTQVRAIAEHVRESVRQECGDTVYHDEGYGAMQWVIVDFVNVVVHVFLPEARKFYRLEEMWSDAAAEEHQDALPLTTPTDSKKPRTRSSKTGAGKL